MHVRPHDVVAVNADAVAARFDLDGRVAVVTGASSGLGAAVARTLAEAGARVALVARRRERLTELAASVDGVAVAADLADDDEVDGVIPRVVEELGTPRVLVNAAGARISDARAEAESAEDIRATLEVNLVAPFRLAQAVQPHMAAAGGGAIVMVASIGGVVGVPGIPQASYAAAKRGLSGLTVELAVQWARHDIRVNTLAPGFFESEITAALFDSERGRTWLRRNTPLGEDPTAEQLAATVLWLVSDAGRSTTGQTITVDAGWTAR